MKAQRTVLAALLATLLVVVVVTPAYARTLTYRIGFRGGEFYENDLNGDGDSDDGGEYEVGSFVLKKSGDKVGHFNFTCFVTEVSPPRDLCWAAIRITGKGQVIAHGSGPGNSETFHGAITGGTGTFRSASGTMLLDFGGQPPTLTLDID